MLFHTPVDACLTNIKVPGYTRMPWHDKFRSVRWSDLIAMERFDPIRVTAQKVFDFLERRKVMFPTATEWSKPGTLRLRWAEDERCFNIYFSPDTDALLYSVGRVDEVVENKVAGDLDILLEGIATWLNPPRPTLPLSLEEMRRGEECQGISRKCIRGRDRGDSLKRSG